MSRRSLPQEATAGGLLNTPPSGSQIRGAAVPRLVVHHVGGAEAEDVEAVVTPGGDRRRTGEPPAQRLPVRRRGAPGAASHALWYIGLSVPRPKMSRRSCPRRRPPADWRTPRPEAPSPSARATSRAVPRLVVHLIGGAEAEDVEAVVPQEATAGGLANPPPSGSQSVGEGDQAPPSPALSYHVGGAEAEDVEAVVPQEATAGGLANPPPSGSQSVGEGDQAPPPHALWYIGSAVPRPKMSRRSCPRRRPPADC